MQWPESVSAVPRVVGRDAGKGAARRLGSHHGASWQGSPTPGSFKAAAHD